ncbi:MAG: hypothetical protein ACK5OW_01495 [bacterium]
MSKIIKKQDITVLIESTLKSAGIEPKFEGEKEVVSESKVEGVVTETKKEEKPLINEDFQNEMDRFKKLSNYTFKK